MLHILAVWWHSFLAICATIKRALYEPITNYWLSWAEFWVSTSEESTKSVIRESFAVLVRVINGASAWFVSLFFDRSYYRRLRRELTRPNPWSAWWDNDCNSTFNAIIERDCVNVGGGDGDGHTTQPVIEPSCSPQQHPRRLRRRTPPSAHHPPTHRITGAKRNASSDLFQAAAGWAAAEGDIRSGVLEDIKLYTELLVDAMFGMVRRALALVRRLLLLKPPKGAMRPHRSWRGGRRRSMGPHEWTTAEIIRAAGYPVEVHDVCTPDGYLLQVIRIPRHDARDTVFFLHGIFDTELGWVANGVTGSQAFAAYDAGLDVWLGTSRSNPPRAHVNPDIASSNKYFFYSVNELAVYDVGAQVDAIDAIKQRELYAMQLQHAVIAMAREASSPPPPLPLGTTHTASTTKQHHGSGGMRGGSKAHHKHGAGIGQGGGIGHHQGGNSHGWRVGSRPAGGADEQSPPHIAQQPPKRARSSADQHDVGLASHPLPPIHTQRGRAHHHTAGHNHPSSFHSSVNNSNNSMDSNNNMEDNAAWYSPHASQSSGDTTPSRTTPPLPAGCFESPRTPGREPGGSMHGYGVGEGEGACTPEPSESPRPGWTMRTTGGGGIGADTGAAGGTGGAAARVPVSGGGSTSSPEAWHDVPEYIDHTMHNTHMQGEDGVQGEDVILGEYVVQGEDGQWDLPEALRVALDALPSTLHGDVDGNTPEVMMPDLYAQGGVELNPEREAAPISTAASAHLDRIQPELAGTPGGDPRQGPAYRLRAVGHSLGGAMLLMYAVHRRMEGKPHHLSRLVLLTPAGMLREYPKLALWFIILLPPLVRIWAWIWPKSGAPVFLPFWWLRTIFFKLAVDLQHMPALQQLVVALIRWLLSQDPSEWDAAMRMPHYNAGGMPVLAIHVGYHMCQWVKARAFRMYDYGSEARNHAKYGAPTPPDIGAHYDLLDAPVDLLAGRADGIVPMTNVLLHFEAMRRAGTRVTYKEFNFGHLDFTFAVKEELRHYVLSRLLLKA